MLNLPGKNWFRPDEVAEYFCIHRKTVYERINRGEIEAIKIGGSLRISRDTILKLETPVFAQDN